MTYFILTILQIKVALSGLRQVFENERPLKMVKNAFYFSLKALLVLKIFKCFYSRFFFFGNVEKQLDKKDQVNFRIYDVTT